MTNYQNVYMYVIIISENKSHEFWSKKVLEGKKGNEDML